MRTNDPFTINLEKNGIAPDYPGSKSVKRIYFVSCLKIEGIEPIARHSLLSDEYIASSHIMGILLRYFRRHMLFYSQPKGEPRELSIVDHFTLKGYSFTSEELSNAAWPQHGWHELAAWHSGLVLLYNGNTDPTVIKSFYINLNKSSLCQGSDIEIPNGFQCYKITAMSIDEHKIYIAFASNPRKILAWNREQNTLITELAMPVELGSPDLTEITDIVIRKGCIAAVTSLGHIAIWDQQLLVNASSNSANILPRWMSTKVDSLNLGLEAAIEQILMSQNCERIVVLDPLWADNTAYMTQSPETVRTIPARKHGKREESFLRVDEECRIAAVGVIPLHLQDTTPLLKIFVADEDEPQMKLPPFGSGLGANLGKFIDFSLHRNSVKYYGTEGIISIDFAEVRSLPDDVYTCSRNIPFSTACWSGMRRILETEDTNL